MGRIIALPIEVKAREFDAKLLLSTYLLKEGFDVLLGSQGGVWTELAFIKNADIVCKSISKSIRQDLIRVKKNEGRVYILDEEANVFSKNQDNIIKSIFPKNMVDIIDDYLISGERIKELVIKNIPQIDSYKLHVVGHPRFDFVKIPYKEYYFEDIQKIKNRFEPFILLSS